MAALTLKLIDKQTDRELLALWLGRRASLVPFVDEYPYRIGELVPSSSIPYDLGAGIGFTGWYSQGPIGLWWCGLVKLQEAKFPFKRLRSKAGVPSPKLIVSHFGTEQLFRLHCSFTRTTTLRIHVTGKVGRSKVRFDLLFADNPDSGRLIRAALVGIETGYPGLFKPFFGEKTRNWAKCRKCGTVIESRFRHEFVTCPCGAIALDGGYDYMRRCGKSKDFIEPAITDTVKYIKPIEGKKV